MFGFLGLSEVYKVSSRFRKGSGLRRALSTGVEGRGFRSVSILVAEWIHFTLFGPALPCPALKVYTFWGL